MCVLLGMLYVRIGSDCAGVYLYYVVEFFLRVCVCLRAWSISVLVCKPAYYDWLV